MDAIGLLNQSILFSYQDMRMASSHWFWPSIPIIRVHPRHPWFESPSVDPQILWRTPLQNDEPHDNHASMQQYRPALIQIR